MYVRFKYSALRKYHFQLYFLCCIILADISGSLCLCQDINFASEQNSQLAYFPCLSEHKHQNVSEGHVHHRLQPFVPDP